MRKATGLVLLGVLGVSISGPMVKLALMAGATPVSVAFLRMGVTALALSIPALRGGALTGMLRAPWKWKGLAVLASVFLALHYAAWMTSLQKTGTFASVALVCAQPLFVAVFSALLLHEPIHRRAVPGAVMAMTGAVSIGLLSATGRGGDLLGDLLAFSGAITMAGHWLCGRAVRRHVPAMGYMVFVYGCTALLLASALPFLGGFAAPVDSLPPVAVLIAVCTLGGHALFTYALGFVKADLISFALLGEPIGAAVWAWLLFEERVGWQMLLGGGLVLTGLAWYLLSSSKRQAVEIRQIHHNKKDFLQLLLLADEQEDMIDLYLERGDLYALYDGGSLCTTCVVTHEGEGVYEVKSLATDPRCQRQGYGHMMLAHVRDLYRPRARTLLVGTGETPRILSFYQSCGFRLSHRLPNFFTDHYDHPIIEDGVQLIDMVYLRIDY